MRFTRGAVTSEQMSESTCASTQNQSVNYRVLLHTYTCVIGYSVNPIVYICKMAWRRNAIAVEWLESKDKGKTNRVNVKRVLGDLSCATEGTEVVVKFDSCHYRVTIINFLEWQPRKRHRRNTDTCACKQPPQSSAKKTKLRRVE